MMRTSSQQGVSLCVRPGCWEPPAGAPTAPPDNQLCTEHLDQERTRILLAELREFSDQSATRPVRPEPDQPTEELPGLVPPPPNEPDGARRRETAAAARRRAAAVLGAFGILAGVGGWASTTGLAHRIADGRFLDTDQTTTTPTNSDPRTRAMLDLTDRQLTLISLAQARWSRDPRATALGNTPAPISALLAHKTKLEEQRAQLQARLNPSGPDRSSPVPLPANGVEQTTTLVNEVLGFTRSTGAQPRSAPGSADPEGRPGGTNDLPTPPSVADNGNPAPAALSSPLADSHSNGSADTPALDSKLPSSSTLTGAGGTSGKRDRRNSRSGSSDHDKAHDSRDGSSVSKRVGTGKSSHSNRTVSSKSKYLRGTSSDGDGWKRGGKSYGSSHRTHDSGRKYSSHQSSGSHESHGGHKSHSGHGGSKHGHSRGHSGGAHHSAGRD